MVKIAETPLRQGTLSAPRVNVPAATGIGEGLQRFGGVVAETGLDLAEARARSEAQRSLAEARDEWSKRLIEMKQAAPLGAEGFADQVGEAFDESIGQRLDASPPATRAWLEAQLAHERSDLIEKANHFEAASSLEKQKNDVADVINFNANAVRTDGTMYKDALAAARQAIELSDLADPVKAAVGREADNTIAAAYIQGLNEVNPVLARDVLKSGQLDPLLDPQTKHVLVNDNLVELRRRDAEKKQTLTAARAEIREVIGMLEKGFDPGRDTINRLAEIASADPSLADDLADATQLYEFQRQAREWTPADLQNWINGERSRLARKSGVQDVEAARVLMAETLLSTMAEQLRKDPLSWASRTGVRAVQPLQLVGPDALTSIEQRKKDAAAVAGYYGIRPRYLTDDEAAQLASQAEGADADTQLQIAGAISEGFDDTAPDVFEQFANKGAALFAHAGGLLHTGSPAAARDILAGDKAIEKGLSPPPPTEAADLADESLRAFALSPTLQAVHEKAARALYVARASRRGLRSGDSMQFDEDLAQRVQQEAAGAVFTPDGRQFGGITEQNGWPVVVPSDIEIDEFSDLVDQIRDEDLTGAGHADGAPLSADELQDAWLVSVGHGQYRISLTDPEDGDPLWIGTGAGGTRPYVLDVLPLLGKLRARRSGVENIPAPPSGAGAGVAP